LKCVILATPEDEVARTMPFASLADAVAVAMEQWSTQFRAFSVKVKIKLSLKQVE
jgi:hypothetical protein